ncbi:MAG: hypothetical protein A3E87_05675 [Gammaproteobacteria bacterium RIFCSPHIGHO2_12_FULL_35_23]|nr:MAG: hypothetical protein A3E87_05675 [Gammaproteobacteria bacterium RIFCSPHIGHO2_12_FULL_35_23]
MTIAIAINIGEAVIRAGVVNIKMRELINKPHSTPRLTYQTYPHFSEKELQRILINKILLIIYHYQALYHTNIVAIAFVGSEKNRDIIAIQKILNRLISGLKIVIINEKETTIQFYIPLITAYQHKKLTKIEVDPDKKLIDIGISAFKYEIAVKNLAYGFKRGLWSKEICLATSASLAKTGKDLLAKFF